MRTVFTFTLVLLLEALYATAAPPSVPRTNEIARYERIQPAFRSKAISRAQGDLLFAALDGGQQVQRWTLPPGVAEAIPLPARHWLTLTLTNGSVYRIGVSFNGGLVYLPEGIFEVKEAARKRAAEVVSRLDEDLREDIVSAPKPLVYSVSMLEDGGTLSGIASLFYGDATKWRQIYEANRKVIRNPNVIGTGTKLTIPKLQ